MAYADYEHCPGCDAKVIYMGDRDTMDSDELGIVVCWHQACLDAEIARRVAAQRERIRQRLLSCTTCGKIHEPKLRDPDNKLLGHSWAAEDGHPWRRPMIGGHAVDVAIADLLGDTP